MKKFLIILFGCGFVSVLALPLEAASKEFKVKPHHLPKLNVRFRQPQIKRRQFSHLLRQVHHQPDWLWHSEVGPGLHQTRVPSLQDQISLTQRCEFVWTDEMSGEFLC